MTIYALDRRITMFHFSATWPRLITMFYPATATRRSTFPHHHFFHQTSSVFAAEVQSFTSECFSADCSVFHQTSQGKKRCYIVTVSANVYVLTVYPTTRKIRLESRRCHFVMYASSSLWSCARVGVYIRCQSRDNWYPRCENSPLIRNSTFHTHLLISSC